MRGSRESLLAVAGVTGVLLLVVLLTWSASIGPSAVLTGEGPTRYRLETPSTTLSPNDPISPLRNDDPTSRTELPGWLEAVALVVEVLVGLGLLLLVAYGVRRGWEAWRDRRRPEPPEPEPDFDVLAARGVVAARLRADAAAQEELLAGGSPRNGIVACWQRFEELAGAMGMPRRAWETSSEYSLRLLDVAGADTTPVTRLARLYREARFSRHPVGEDDRDAALEALHELHRSLVAGSPR